MKLSSNASRRLFSGFFTAVLGLLSLNAAHAQIFVTNQVTGTIGEYNLDGTTVNSSLISGLNDTSGIVVIPESSTWAMLLGGVGLLMFWRKRLQQAGGAGGR